jgi:hypothetical protein
MGEIHDRGGVSELFGPQRIFLRIFIRAAQMPTEESCNFRHIISESPWTLPANNIFQRFVAAATYRRAGSQARLWRACQYHLSGGFSKA